MLFNQSEQNENTSKTETEDEEKTINNKSTERRWSLLSFLSSLDSR